MFRKRAILIAISSLVAISPNSAIQFTRTFESSNNEPSSLIANEQTVTLQDEIVRENRWYHELRDFYFTNGFSLAPTDLNDVTIRDGTSLEFEFDARSLPPSQTRNDGANGARTGNSSKTFCWFATAVVPECGDVLFPKKVISYFPGRTEHPSESIVVAFVSAIFEQMTREKCGLYCVLQNYPFANYLDDCEICLCGLFMDRLLSLTREKPIEVIEPRACIAGTDLVGVGINATIISVLDIQAREGLQSLGPRRIHALAGVTNFQKLIAGEEYEIIIKVWHWSRFGFVTVTWDLGNDSIRPNETVGILNNGFGFTRKRFKYSSPGVFRLKLMADDGFHEVFQELSLEVLPSEGKTQIVAVPTFPRTKEVITFKAPEFVVDPFQQAGSRATYMWFFQDPISFSEVTTTTATKAYTEPGVYRVDVSVTSQNISKTGSIDVVVEGILEGLYVACESLVDVNRIVNIGVRVDRGTHFHFILNNGLPNTEPIVSSTGRFKVLYSQPGQHNLSVTAVNHIGKLQSMFTISVTDPEFIAVRGFDLPESVVVNETVPLKILIQAENPQDFFFEWHFSDNSKTSGPGLSTVSKSFQDTGDVRIKLLITGKKGTRKVLHGVISVVTLCSIVPVRGVALETKFRLICKGMEGPLPGLDIHHAIIANPTFGFFDILYPKASHDILLPDLLDGALNWTISFPGHSGCDIRDGCLSNCCPIFKASVARDGNSKSMSEILETMDKLLDKNAKSDPGHILSVLLVQSAIIVRANPSPAQLKTLTTVVAKMTADLSESFALDGKVSLGGQLFELLVMLAKSDSFQLSREGAIAVLQYLVVYINEMAPQTNIPTPKDAVFGLVKQILRGLARDMAAAAPTDSPKLPGSVLDLLRPIGRIVGSYVNELTEKAVLTAEDVMVSAVKVNVTKGSVTITSEGLSVTLPPETSAPLVGAPVVLVVGKTNKAWLQPTSATTTTPAATKTDGVLYFAALLDRNFKEIDLTSQTSETGIKIVLPAAKDSLVQPRLGSGATSPATFNILPRFATRIRLALRPSEVSGNGQAYLSLALRCNDSVTVPGRLTVTLLDALDSTLQRQAIPYSELHQTEDHVVRWPFPAVLEAKYLTLSNEGSLHVQLSARLFVTECGDAVNVCAPDELFESPLSMRTCVCKALWTFAGHSFEVFDFLSLEKTMELHLDHKSAVTVTTLGVVALGYIVALIATTLRHKGKVEQRHVLSVGAGSQRYNVLFWGRDGARDEMKGSIFPLKLHVMGTACRLEYILSIQRHSSFGYNLLVTMLSDRDPGDFTAIRISGRLPESTFPFYYATIAAHNSEAVFHFRLSAPRLVEESRGGVVFEVSSKPTSFPPRKILSMECQRRLKKDHLWIAAVRIKGPLAVRLEMLSVGVTSLFAFMGVCALGYTFAGAPSDLQDETRPFRPRSRDILLGLWTALLITPLITVILEILNRCHHRCAKQVSTIESGTEAKPNLDPPLNADAARTGTRTRATDSNTASRPSKNPHSQAITHPSSVTNPPPPLTRLEYGGKIRTKSDHASVAAVAEPSSPEVSSSLPPHSQVTPPAKIFTLAGLCSLSPLCRRLLAYVLCFTLSCLSVCLVLLFGLNYGLALSLRWLLSCAVAFLVSFICLEPVKLIGKSLWICYTTTSEGYFHKMFTRCQYGLPM